MTPEYAGCRKGKIEMFIGVAGEVKQLPGVAARVSLARVVAIADVFEPGVADHPLPAAIHRGKQRAGGAGRAQTLPPPPMGRGLGFAQGLVRLSLQLPGNPP